MSHFKWLKFSKRSSRQKFKFTVDCFLNPGWKSNWGKICSESGSKKSFIFKFPLISFNVHTFCEQNQVHNFNVESKTLEGYISLLHQHHLKCAIHLGLLKKFSHLFVSRLWKQTILKNLWICLLNYTFFDVPLTETRLPRNRKVLPNGKSWWIVSMGIINVYSRKFKTFRVWQFYLKVCVSSLFTFFDINSWHGTWWKKDKIQLVPEVFIPSTICLLSWVLAKIWCLIWKCSSLFERKNKFQISSQIFQVRVQILLRNGNLKSSFLS